MKSSSESARPANSPASMWEANCASDAMSGRSWELFLLPAPAPNRRFGPMPACCNQPINVATPSNPCTRNWFLPWLLINLKILTSRLNVKVLRQTEYYAEQSRAVTKLITTLGVLVALLMAIGAVFGALNTMY